MNIETYRFCIGAVESHFGSSFVKESKNKVWAQIKAEPDTAMEQAAELLMLGSNVLPPPIRLIELVRSQGQKVRVEEAKAREQQAARDKVSYKPLSQFQAPTEFGRMCSALTRELLSGAITKEVFLLTGVKIAEAFCKEQMRQGLEEDLGRHYSANTKQAATAVARSAHQD